MEFTHLDLKKKSKKEIMTRIIDYFIDQLIVHFGSVAVLGKNEDEREYIETSSYTPHTNAHSQVRLSQIIN